MAEWNDIWASDIDQTRPRVRAGVRPGEHYAAAMGKVYPTLDEPLRAFIRKQHLFFVATAPSGSDGHINLSPKGLDSFVVLNDTRVAYIDFTGSGAETIAHLRQNGRISVMFCAFDGPPKILRLYGRGSVVEPGDVEFDSLRAKFGEYDAPMVRSIIVIDVTRIADACGYAVPKYGFEGHRDQLHRFAANKGEQGMLDYQRAKNSHSIDQLPALRWTDDD